MWADRDVVVVDAVLHPTCAAGTVLTITSDQLGLGPAAPVSSHGVGLAEVWALAASLGCAPRRLTLVGVVAGSVTPGTPLSAEVAAAVGRAVDVVLDLVQPRLIARRGSRVRAGRGRS